MDLILFVFIALPLATILLSIVLQKVLRSPILVAITFFAIYLIVAFAAFQDNLAIALLVVIILTIIAFLTAYIVMLICRYRRRMCYNNELIDRALCNTTNEVLGNNSQFVDIEGTTVMNRNNNMQRRCYRR